METLEMKYAISVIKKPADRLSSRIKRKDSGNCKIEQKKSPIGTRGKVDLKKLTEPRGLVR